MRNFLSWSVEGTCVRRSTKCGMRSNAPRRRRCAWCCSAKIRTTACVKPMAWPSVWPTRCCPGRLRCATCSRSVLPIWTSPWSAPPTYGTGRNRGSSCSTLCSPPKWERPEPTQERAGRKLWPRCYAKPWRGTSVSCGSCGVGRHKPCTSVCWAKLEGGVAKTCAWLLLTRARFLRTGDFGGRVRSAAPTRSFNLGGSHLWPGEVSSQRCAFTGPKP